MSITDENAPWYHTSLSRTRAEEMLVQAEKNGAFIVRASESINGAFVLSEFYNNRVHHYRILPSDEGYFIECPGSTTLHYFEWLKDLVDFYGKPKRGLVCELTYAVELEDDEDDDIDSITLESSVKYFNALSNQINLSNPDQDLEKQFREYFSKHILADSRKCIFDEKPDMFHRLFENDIANVFSSINILQKRLLYAHELLSLALGNNSETSSLEILPLESAKKDFSTANSVLANTTDLISKTSVIADQVFKQLNSESFSDDVYKICRNNSKKVISELNVADSGNELFEVLMGDKLSRATIQVNTLEGFIIIQKNSSKQTILCVDLIQLIKNHTHSLCLTVVHKQGENINVTFQRLQLRERFCDALMLMMNQHNFNLAKESISLFTGTWNMGEAPAPETIESWLIGKGTGMNLQGYDKKIYDLYLIGVQENDALLLRIQSSDWPSKLRSIISNMNKLDYKIIAFEHFWHIGLVAIIKADLYKKVSNIQQAKVKTGLGKINVGTIVGNKGAVGVSFAIDKTSFLFINCHLTSGHEQKRLEKRRANYRDIMKNLIFKSVFPHCDITNQFNYIFFFGDLNYRLDLDFETILERISDSDYDYLKQFDQLTMEIAKNNAFFAFEEAPILFPPTYRYVRGSRSSYHILKKKPVKDRINVPSYCDRILFKSLPNSPLLSISYGCTDDIITSDHSPVYATFLLGIQTHNISKFPLNTSVKLNNTLSIHFEEFEAYITRSTPHEMYYIQCFSNCFEGIRKSKQCSIVKEVNGKSNNFIAIWTHSELQELIISVNNDFDFLMQQIIFVQIKCSSGDDDTFGEAHISLSEFLGKSGLKFHKILTYQTYPVGKIIGKLFVGDLSHNLTNVRQSKGETYNRLDIVYSTEQERFSEHLDSHILSNPNISTVSTTSAPRSMKQSSKYQKIDCPNSFTINETIDTLQNTDLHTFLIKYNLDVHFEKLVDAGFKDTIQLYFLDEKYLVSMGITGDDGKKIFLLAQFISQLFCRVK